MPKPSYYDRPEQKNLLSFSAWDLLFVVLVLGCLCVLVFGAESLVAPFEIGDAIPISLEPTKLFSYSLESIFRMSIALAFSFLATFLLGSWAAKSHRAERILIPLIDILQSIPILGFQSISIMTFICLFPGNLLGPQCAAIFAIFTSQVWNMILSFYQALRSVPKDLKEAACVFQLNTWQIFWRVEVPFAMPSLLWNTMMSLSAGWFFVVASEAISVSHQNITLPGIGSYINLALIQGDDRAIVYAVLVMLCIILMYDQLIFRPLLAWSDKFKSQTTGLEDPPADPWFLTWLHRSLFIRWIGRLISRLQSLFINIRLPAWTPQLFKRRWPSRLETLLSTLLLSLTLLGSTSALLYFMSEYLTFSEVFSVLGLGLITAFKVFVLIIIASLIWIPIGTWIGLNGRRARIMQPIVQFCAAFPADVVYPFFMMMILTFHLNVDIWSSPLMILGTQWYILFNVIAGAQSIPSDLKQAVQNYGVKGWLWWKRLILPAIFPYYITGAITAAGGSWNASILADVIRWGDVTLHAKGLGGYIDTATRAGDFPRIALGIGVMCLFVTVINRFVWRRLYKISESHDLRRDRL